MSIMRITETLWGIYERGKIVKTVSGKTMIFPSKRKAAREARWRYRKGVSVRFKVDISFEDPGSKK